MRKRTLPDPHQVHEVTALTAFTPMRDLNAGINHFEKETAKLVVLRLTEGAKLAAAVATHFGLTPNSSECVRLTVAAIRSEMPPKSCYAQYVNEHALRVGKYVQDNNLLNQLLQVRSCDVLRALIPTVNREIADRTRTPGASHDAIKAQIADATTMSREQFVKAHPGPARVRTIRTPPALAPTACAWIKYSGGKVFADETKAQRVVNDFGALSSGDAKLVLQICKQAGYVHSAD
jgi:hypothetical protein